jgi:hypothetical protein
MRFRIKSKEHLTDWHDYFVWFPMVIRDSDTKKRFWVWLETIRCRRHYTKNHYAYWQYRIKWPTHGEWNI